MQKSESILGRKGNASGSIRPTSYIFALVLFARTVVAYRGNLGDPLVALSSAQFGDEFDSIKTGQRSRIDLGIVQLFFSAAFSGVAVVAPVIRIAIQPCSLGTGFVVEVHTFTIASPKIDRSKYVFLVLRGAQGTGKTFASKVIKNLIDPSSIDAQTLPNAARDLGIMLQACHLAHQRSRAWPSSAASMSKRLHGLQGPLLSQGVEILIARGKERQIVVHSKNFVSQTSTKVDSGVLDF